MKNTIISIILLFILLGCSKNNVINTLNNSSNPNEGWLVPSEKLFISELEPDRIQSIDNPVFQNINNSQLSSDEIVFIYRFAEIVKVYPLSILAGHEIVNDRIGNHHYAITYCPLTGSAIAFNREVSGVISEFGVSGHLYNENLIPYDRFTNSMWSQMMLRGIKGDYGGQILEIESLAKTKASFVKKSFPLAIVLQHSSNDICNDSICITGSGTKNEGIDDQSTIENIIGDHFGIISSSLVFGYSDVILYNYSNFNDSITILNKSLKGAEIIVVGSKFYQFIVAFKVDSNENIRYFNPVNNSLPLIFKDNLGNGYDITGYIIEGPNTGERLQLVNSYWATGFAWSAFFGSRIEISND